VTLPKKMPEVSRALWIAGCGASELRTEALPQTGEVLVQALFSGVSRGTERLVFEGRVGAELHEVMSCPHQAGHFSFPVKYGYCAVGRVLVGPPELVGKMVFCLHPHQDFFWVRRNFVALLPEVLEPAHAVLAANMETALNALWDSGVTAGFRVAVVGAGAVGLLLACLLDRLPGIELFVWDTSERRRALCETLGLRVPSEAPKDAACDVVFHCSGHPAGLATALDLAGFEARVMELSWYGTTVVPVGLGGRFHSSRLQLCSTQVGSVASVQRARWSHQRRLELALRLLVEIPCARLVGCAVPFESRPW
jgi:threonine dehydrogenase-like Zn-dependent dehydrogenase